MNYKSNKPFSRGIVIISSLISLGVLLLSLVIFLPSIFKKPTPRPNTATANTKALIVYNIPKRLIIPSIGIDAAVEYVGIGTNGAMGDPVNPNDVAWYSGGKRPGETGSAVMAGHFGTWENGQGSVFDNLNKLKTTDKISVIDDRGVTTGFVVSEIRSLPARADATGIFRSDNSLSYLNLITCQGNWNPATQSYPDRLVVSAIRE